MFIESGHEPKRDIFSLASLAEWLETKPRDGTYDYTCPTSCLLAQYFQAMGKKNIAVGTYRVSFNLGGPDMEKHYLPPEMVEAASGFTHEEGMRTLGSWRRKHHKKWTFGQAHDRAIGKTAEPKTGLLDRLVASFAS